MKKVKFINVMGKLIVISRIQPLLLFFLVLMTSGCAHVISKDLREKADSTLTFRQVLQNPNAYKDKTVLWGGEIIKTLNQKDGTTIIEVFERPLGWRGEPKITGASEGRFLVLADKYLDPYLFRRGRKITVAGEILGEKIQPVGEMEYRYPLLSSKQIYLWEHYYYHPYPYYYYPWWYDDPWWGYPRWWWRLY
jgi:outer membrane lipoprotein